MAGGRRPAGRQPRNLGMSPPPKPDVGLARRNPGSEAPENLAAGVAQNHASRSILGSGG
jgi:hypothetical protein